MARLYDEAGTNVDVGEDSGSSKEADYVEIQEKVSDIEQDILDQKLVVAAI